MRRAALIVVSLCLVACQGAAPPQATPVVTSAPVDSTSMPVTPTEDPAEESPTPTAAPTTSVFSARDSVVRIVAEGTFYAPLSGEQETASQGTGFIIDPSGVVVTNNHVVTGGSIFKVYFEDSTTDFTRAQLLGQSECSDLAVLQLLGEAEYPALTWYEGDVEPGQPVQAAGYPEDTYSLREGQVTTSPSSLATQWAAVDNVIEHTAEILPGFSGGPLLTDPQGQVLAVDYARDEGEPRSYAVAADQARRIVDQLSEGEDVDSIGINGQAVVSEDGSISGIWVASVKPGSPADRAEIIPGDLIVELGDLRVGEDGTMQRYCDVLIGNPGETPLQVTWANIEEGLCYTAQLHTEDRRGQAVRCPDDIVLGTGNGDEPTEMSALIHSSVRDTCTEATPWEGADASLSCTPTTGADSLWFDQFPSAEAMNEYFDGQVEVYDIPSGGACEDGSNVSDWTLDETYVGRLLCYSNELGVWYQYTYDDRNVLITALRNDGDFAALWEWWRTADEAILAQ